MENTPSVEQLDAERHLRPGSSALGLSVARWLAGIPLLQDRSVLLDY
jgi:hypothetical protein